MSISLIQQMLEAKKAKALEAQKALESQQKASSEPAEGPEHPASPVPSSIASSIQPFYSIDSAIETSSATEATKALEPKAHGAAAILAALRAKSLAKAKDAAASEKVEKSEAAAQQPAIRLTDAPAPDDLPQELQTELPTEAESLAATAKELATIEVIDATGVSLGSFTYSELKAKIKGLAAFAKVSKKAAEKLALFEAKKMELEEIAEQWAEASVKAEAKEAQKAKEKESTKEKEKEKEPEEPKESFLEELKPSAETFALDITLNANQLAASEMALAGKSFVLIGAAGTGKTTCQRAVAASLLKQGMLKTINFSSKEGESLLAPSFAGCAFTRRASGNLRRAIHKDPVLKDAFIHNVLTIHALLEYEPVYYFDEVLQKETMRFLPRRDAQNPLELTHLVIEEASMVGAYDLWQALYEALPEGVQIIFIGDINQLPPVFGPSILNYALTQLPVIELTEVYRQAGDSGILANAHQILKGQPLLPAKDVHIIQGKNKEAAGQEKTALAVHKMFDTWHDQGVYDPEEDMILSPYNEQALGTINLNAWIAQFLGQKREAIVYEVIAGFNKHYLAVGDKVMYNKQDGIVTKIAACGDYFGKMPQPAGKDLTRFGGRIAGMAGGVSLDDEHMGGYAHFDLDKLIEDKEERKLKASHIVTVALESGAVVDLNTSGDFGPQVFSLGYVLTGHKAQGCEWRKVFIILHPGHRTMIFREWLYTSWTRAREELFVIAKDWLLEKAIQNPRIKGNSLAEKVAYFNSGLGQLQAGVSCTKG